MHIEADAFGTMVEMLMWLELLAHILNESARSCYMSKFENMCGIFN